MWNWKPFTICARYSILDVWQVSEYASGYQNNFWLLDYPPTFLAILHPLFELLGGQLSLPKIQHFLCYQQRCWTNCLAIKNNTSILFCFFSNLLKYFLWSWRLAWYLHALIGLVWLVPNILLRSIFVMFQFRQCTVSILIQLLYYKI